MKHTFSHLSIAVNALEILEASFLDLTRFNHPLTYLFTWFSSLHRTELGEGNVLKFDLQVDAVEQRTGDFIHITLNLTGRADAMVRGVAIIPTRAGVHGGDQHEGTGVLDVVLGTADGYLAVLQRLTKHLEYVA